MTGTFAPPVFRPITDPAAPAYDTGTLDMAEADRYIDWWARPGRILLGETVPELDDIGETCVFASRETPCALRIFASGCYDPGNQAYRLHSAINRETPHASLYGVLGNQNPFAPFRQIDLLADRHVAQVALASADIIHCHMHPWAIGYLGVKYRGRVVIHYHGSNAEDEPKDLVQHERDRHWNLIQIGARLDHGEYGDIPWVPMTVPVTRLAALRNYYRRPGVPGRDRPFRIAHSPTLRRVKGTEAFLVVCESLAARGLPVEPVLIEGHRHDHALAWKATCDAVFDSFWLGLQGSGLEGGAMGLPVFAGDARCQRLHIERFGACPYTFTPDPVALEAAIVQCIEDPTWAEVAAIRMEQYVTRWHSYYAVAHRYFEVLAERAPELAATIRAASRTVAARSAMDPKCPAYRPDDPLPWNTVGWSLQYERPEGIPDGASHAAQ